MAKREGIQALRSAVRRASRRALVDSLLRRAMLLAPVPLSYGIAALTVVKVLRLSTNSARPLLWLSLVPVGVFVVGVARVFNRVRAPWQGALALDTFHGLHDRVTTALAFDDVPAAERTPLMHAAIEDGIAAGNALDPRRAVPLRLPRETWLVALLSLGLIGLSLLEVRTLRRLPSAPSFEPMVMNPDDLELFRGLAQELQAKTDDPSALVAVRRFNQLVEDIAEHRLDRLEVFRRMGELERQLKDSATLEQEARDEGLKGLARELEKSGLSKPAATALDEKRLADAEKALRALADQLKKKPGKPSRAELDKLRRALEKASQTSAARLKSIEARRRELEAEKSLFKKKHEQPDAGAPTDAKQAENERRLERLDREQRRAEQSQKQMSELDQQLAQAARDLMKDSGQSAEDLEQGAQDINRMARKEASTEQKQELLRKLRELRELMRQQGTGGKDRAERLRRFGQRARGQRGAGEGQGEGEQSGSKSHGGSQDGPLRLGSGASGPSVEIPMPQTAHVDGASSSGARPGAGAPGSGREAGTGHDPNLVGKPTDLKGQTHDVTAVGVDTGQGAASSQVIYGAAQRGFVGRGYKKVFTDYQTVEEQALSKDVIPSGYRFYVRRYFQLIRPRE